MRMTNKKRNRKLKELRKRVKALNDFYEIVEKSLNHKGENKYFDCNITLKFDGIKHLCHEVSICNRDLLFFSDKGTLNYVVDSYGLRNVVELVNI